MLEESETETNKSKSLKSIEEEKDDEEDEIPLMQSTSCPKLPSMIESCNPLWISQEASVNKVQINDFILLKALSHGAYGKVCLAMRKKTRDIFAIKIIDKKALLDENQKEFVINERNILN